MLFKIVQNLSKNVLAGRWRLIQCAHCGRIIQFSNGTLELIMSVNGQYAQNYLQFIICKRIHFSKGDFRRFYMVLYIFHLFLFFIFGFSLILHGLSSYILIWFSVSTFQALILILPTNHPFFFEIKRNFVGLIHIFFIALFHWSKFRNLFGFYPIFTLMRIVLKYIEVPEFEWVSALASK